jgi:hypothetical protein
MLLRTINGELWYSSDEAGEWKKVDLEGAVIFSMVHEFDPMRVGYYEYNQMMISINTNYYYQ